MFSSGIMMSSGIMLSSGVASREWHTKEGNKAPTDAQGPPKAPRRKQQEGPQGASRRVLEHSRAKKKGEAEKRGVVGFEGQGGGRPAAKARPRGLTS